MHSESPLRRDKRRKLMIRRASAAGERRIGAQKNLVHTLTRPLSAINPSGNFSSHFAQLRETLGMSQTCQGRISSAAISALERDPFGLITEIRTSTLALRHSQPSNKVADSVDDPARKDRAWPPSPNGYRLAMAERHVRSRAFLVTEPSHPLLQNTISGMT